MEFAPGALHPHGERLHEDGEPAGSPTPTTTRGRGAADVGEPGGL